VFDFRKYARHLSGSARFIPGVKRRPRDDASCALRSFLFVLNGPL
jgi:hypothetical protein